MLIELELVDVQKILGCLNQFPYGEVAEVIHKIAIQASAQGEVASDIESDA